MAGFFDDMAEMVGDLLQPDDEGGLGTAAGSIELLVGKPYTKDPDSPWIAPEPVFERQMLRAHALGGSQSMIDGETVMNGYQDVISEVTAIEWTVPAGDPSSPAYISGFRVAGQ